MPYTRVLAAFMLATLISTIFALPANAAVATIANTGPAKVLPATAYAYTVTVTNDVTPDTNVVVTDTVTVATPTGTPSFVLSGAPLVVVPCVGAVPGPFTCTAPTLAASETMTITVNVTSGAAGTTGTNNATVDSDNSAPNPASQASTPVENADLVVTKSYAGATSPGGTGTYTITVNNPGPSIATDVTLNDTAPAGVVTFGTVTVASVPPGISTCAPAPTAMTLACAWATIPVGTTVTVTVPATISGTATAGSSVANTASTTATSLDATPSNNTDTETFVVGAASVDLAVGISVDPTTAAPGDTVTYTVTVTNPTTTDDATGVVVTDVLPAGLTADAVPPTPSVGTVAVANNTWTWTVGTVGKAVAPATSNAVTASFTATVDDPATLTTITNTVTMTSTTTDPETTNNTASVDLAISGDVADLNINTALSEWKVNQGDFIDITVSVVNNGPADATNVVAKNILPTGLKMGACAGCDQTGQNIRPVAGLRQSSQDIIFGTILSGETAQATLTVAVMASGGNLQNRAVILSLDQTDPNDTNDESLTQLITVGGVSGNPGGGSGGGTGGSGGGTGGTGGGTAFTGFTAGQLMPWFMLLFTLGLVAVEWSRRTRLVSPIGSTYGFEPFQS